MTTEIRYYIVYRNERSFEFVFHCRSNFNGHVLSSAKKVAKFISVDSVLILLGSV